ncbi:MAG: spermidine/putrescine ABC transporter substrate-binding protein [Alphaproteobacteria bacterium]|nr:spermidine/putrescine ABC transporter substrate-binding protein [Alphaproteobacteria bacterium]
MNSKYHISRRSFLMGSSALAAVGITFSPLSANSNNELNFYNWDDYIGENTLSDFADNTGIKTKLDFFADNDELFSKLREGNPGYDIIVPSDIYVEKMVKANMLERIDHGKISNMNNIDTNFLDPVFDPKRQHSIPYMWGSIGIGYDKKRTGITPDSWSYLYESNKYSGNISLLSEATSVMAIGLKYLGYSANSTNPKEYKQVEELLINQKKHIKVFAEDNGQDLLASGDVILAQEFNGDIAQVMLEDDNISYLVPKEGSLIWEDCLCIPKDAPNIENAHKFIDFILRADIGAELADYIQYATPNKAAKDLMDEEYTSNPAIFPSDETVKLCENQIYLGEDVGQMIQDTWTRILAS